MTPGSQRQDHELGTGRRRLDRAAGHGRPEHGCQREARDPPYAPAHWRRSGGAITWIDARGLRARTVRSGGRGNLTLVGGGLRCCLRAVLHRARRFHRRLRAGLVSGCGPLPVAIRALQPVTAREQQPRGRHNGPHVTRPPVNRPARQSRVPVRVLDRLRQRSGPCPGRGLPIRRTAALPDPLLAVRATALRPPVRPQEPGPPGPSPGAGWLTYPSGG